MTQGDQGTARAQVPESEKGHSYDKGGPSRSDKPEGTNDEAVTEETGNDPDSTIRNPSGDDLGDAVDGDEGSGKRF